MYAWLLHCRKSGMESNASSLVTRFDSTAENQHKKHWTNQKENYKDIHGIIAAPGQRGESDKPPESFVAMSIFLKRLKGSVYMGEITNNTLQKQKHQIMLKPWFVNFALWGI